MLKGGLWKAADSERDDSMRGFLGGLFRPGDKDSEEDSEEGGSEEGNSGEGNSDEGSSGEGNPEEGSSKEGNSGEGNSGERSSGEGNSEEGSSGEGDSEEGSSGEGNSEEGSSGEEVPGREIDGEEDSSDSGTESLMKDPEDALGKQPEGGFSPVFALLLGIAAIAIFLMGLGLGRIWGKKKYGTRKRREAMKKDPGFTQKYPEPAVKKPEFVEQCAKTEETPALLGLGGRLPGSAGTVGKLHNIGMRNSQQDSLGVTGYSGGLFAVVADGMGGLSDGDKVSQKVVLTMLQDAVKLSGGKTAGMLWHMTAHVNREVNHMLGAANQYKSGSTLIAVLVENGSFQWISVGDSRIYLYRQGQLLQMNREHVYEVDLRHKAVNGLLSFAEAAADPQKKHIASFIGMGELKYVDSCMRPMPTCAGDRLLLMSDGVFNTLSEEEIRAVLLRGENAENTAAILEEQVLARRNPKQDNFTAVILDL